MRGRDRPALRRRPVGPTDSGDSWLRSAGVWLIAAKLLLIPLVLDPLGEDPFALPKSAMSRGLLYVELAVAAAYVVRYRPRPRPAPLAIAVIAFIVASSIASVFALDPTSALFGAHRRYLGLTSILDGAAFAAGIALFVRTQRDLLILGSGGLAALFLTLAYGALQLWGKDPITWPERTLSSFIGNSTSVGGYVVICGSAVLVVTLIYWRSLRWWARTALISLMTASVALTVLTGARAPTLATLPSALAAAVIAWRARAICPGLRTAVLALAGALLLSAGLLAGPFGERLADLVSNSDASLSERSVIYETAIKAILARPELGVGPDGMGSIYLAFRSPKTAQMTSLTATETSTHSWVVHHALGTGLVGASAFIAIVGLALLEGWRRAATPNGIPAAVGAVALVAYLTQGLFTINSVVTDMLMWVAIGLIAIPTDTSVGRGAQDQRWARRADGPVTILVVLVGLVAASTVSNVLEANRAVHASNLARAAGNVALAQRAGQAAVQRDSGRADHWNVLGLAYSRRDRERAAQAFARASARAPRDPVYLLNLAAEEVLASDRDPAKRDSASSHAQRAIELDPNGVLTLRRSSEVFGALRQFDAAIALARRARDLVPDDRGAHDWLAWLFGEAGHPEDAITELERAISLDPAQASSPRLELPEELRLRLSRLYRSAGRLDEARSLIHTPSVSGADRLCSPLNGMGEIRAGGVRPRCFRILVASEEALAAEGTSGGSVRNTARYLVDSFPLPEGTIVEYDGKTVVTIQLPAGAVPPRPRSPVTVTGLANVLGQRTRPDPVSFELP